MKTVDLAGVKGPCNVLCYFNVLNVQYCHQLLVFSCSYFRWQFLQWKIRKSSNPKWHKIRQEMFHNCTESRYIDQLLSASEMTMLARMKFIGPIN